MKVASEEYRYIVKHKEAVTLYLENKISLCIWGRARGPAGDELHEQRKVQLTGKIPKQIKEISFQLLFPMGPR